VLLDTCVFLWLADDQEMLSPRARQLIADNAGSLFISSISAFEIAVKHRKGALRLPLSPADWIGEALEHHGITDIPVDWRIAERSASLPPLHRAPADRLIVAHDRPPDPDAGSPHQGVRRDRVLVETGLRSAARPRDHRRARSASSRLLGFERLRTLRGVGWRREQ
jgi:PIN domain nuclease of toxin-antitoxin system